jgi:GNAT superfamily N-acetyltransferase
MRPATPADLPVILSLLRRHEQTSMFPLANLAGPGLGGSGPLGMRVWLSGDGRGLVGLTNAGMLLPQWPGAADWSAARAALAGATVGGASGPAGQVRALIAALGLADAPCQHDADEPGFALDLADLRLPEGPGVLAPLDAAPQDLLFAWRAAYLVEVLGAPAVQAAERAPAEVGRWRTAGSHRLLLVDGRPVALAGVNARLPDVVQVGGVYVPPDLRGKGLARRAVALLLDEMRATGVARAVLFSVSPAATRAYRAIGFRPAEPIGLVLFAAARQVSPCR